MRGRKHFKDVDEYMASAPEKARPKLQEMRRAIREVAPNATEVISYSMPAFKAKHILVYFGAFKNHIGFYPTSSDICKFKEEFSAYKTSTGAVQFPLNEALPLNLVRKIVLFRLREDAAQVRKPSLVQGRVSDTTSTDLPV